MLLIQVESKISGSLRMRLGARHSVPVQIKAIGVPGILIESLLNKSL